MRGFLFAKNPYFIYKKHTMIITRTPFRISFFGGGTDYPAWFEENGGAVLSTTIDKYCHVSCRYLPPFFGYKSRVAWSKVQLVNSWQEIEHPAVRGALRYMGIDEGVEIHNFDDLPARSGMGSSSSFSVGILHALLALKGKKPSKSELALAAIHLEQNLLKENVGCQDQAAAAFGGLNKITFGGSSKVAVEPVGLTPLRMKQFHDHLLLFFTGRSRFASEIAAEQVKKTRENANELRRMHEMVDESIKILKSGDLNDFGKLLHESWTLKRGLSSKISTDEIDAMYEAGREAGALGGKLLGAGGGGFMLFFAPPERHAAIRQKLSNFLYIPFEFDNDGSKVIYQKAEANPFHEMDFMILCGGLGTRLKPAVSDRPKPMAEVGGHPFLDILVSDLVRKGFKRIILCTGHMSDHIESHFKKRSFPVNVSIEISREEKPLGTGGAVKNALPLVKSDHFFVMNGDTFPRVSFRDFYESHTHASHPLSIALVERRFSNGQGNVTLGKNGVITSFEDEFKDESEGFSSAGCYVMRKKDIADFFPEKEEFSLEHEVFPALAGASHGFVYGGFLDIGTPERYRAAGDFFS